MIRIKMKSVKMAWINWQKSKNNEKAGQSKDNLTANVQIELKKSVTKTN